MRRSLTWVSGTILAGIFLALAAVLTHSPAPAPAYAQLAVSTTGQPSFLPVPAAAPPLAYTVQPGDTLSSIAASLYGSARLWPALWYVNRHQLPNPDMLPAGLSLQLSTWHPDKGWIYADALAAIPAPPAPEPAAVTLTASQPQAASQPVTVAAQASVSAGAPGSFQACVIAAESGGDASAVNPASGAGGLYGFLPSTWASLGYSGLPEDAPVAEQNAAFAREYAQSGTSAWSAYDGC